MLYECEHRVQIFFKNILVIQKISEKKHINVPKESESDTSSSTNVFKELFFLKYYIKSYFSYTYSLLYTIKFVSLLYYQ